MTSVVLIKTAAVVGIAGEGAIVGLAVIDPSITNLISAVVGGVVAITLGWFGFRTTMASLAKKVDAQADKVDQTLQKAAVIEGHVNSEKTEAQGKIALLEKENLLLREMVMDKKTTAALLAQAAATTATSPVRAPAKAADPTLLKEIAINTAETAEASAKTAENTARTEASTARTEANMRDLKDKP